MYILFCRRFYTPTYFLARFRFSLVARCDCEAETAKLRARTSVSGPPPSPAGEPERPRASSRINMRHMPNLILCLGLVSATTQFETDHADLFMAVMKGDAAAVRNSVLAHERSVHGPAQDAGANVA